ncbi:hypothetical protein MLD63_14060 [Paracoccus sp. TK19116]|uniref:DUF2971 domain-containing protein n=1 Tax=Paracoccus albicereus TaxID=2922394 RepID=A0ABT1MTN0_9RHOB|nr:hypothetical protein [Paracoccus albicereus]MCQ0971546.1 hypothetical protein [Paracoccus albicereus]
MIFSDDQLIYLNVFSPEIIKKYNDVEKNNKRFVYYTSAETALRIIDNQEIWLRNTTVMNDFSEIHYGVELVYYALEHDDCEFFRDAINEISPSATHQLINSLKEHVTDWQHETYIACVSEHRDEEDNSGRLSMWRAYGNTGLVVRNTPLVSDTTALQAFSVPVRYQSRSIFLEDLRGVCNRIQEHEKYYAVNADLLSIHIFHYLFTVALSSKHPGFQEELEWRIFYRPNEAESSAITGRVVVIDGVPQKIFAIPLVSDTSKGLIGTDVVELVDRIIIGPTEYPYVSYKAFCEALEKHGVKDTWKRVIVSDIPLRSR